MEPVLGCPSEVTRRLQFLEVVWINQRRGLGDACGCDTEVAIGIDPANRGDDGLI
jgi:hypothetical protein